MVVFLWILNIVILYLVIKFAVKHGVTEAHEELIESVRAIERKLDVSKNSGDSTD
jgi:hypothetical protein